MNTEDTTRVVLDNGMIVLVKERHSAPVVAINTWVNAGYFNEPDSLTGISHLLEHMFFKGTDKREVGELREETKRLGGYLNGGTIYEYTHYYTVLPSSFVAQGLEIQSDALWNSTIDSAELSKETKVVIQEVKRKLDRPDALAWESLMELAFDEHPIRRWRMGTPEQIEAWTRDHLLHHYKSFYRPDNIILAVVGDVNTEEVLEQIRHHYGGVKVGETKKKEIPREPPQTQLKYRQMKGDITQTYLKIGFHIPGRLDDDFFPLEVLAHVLGHGRSSRLSQRLIERMELVSSVSTEAFAQKDFGVFLVEVELEAEDLLESELEIFREIERLKKEEILQDELAKAKNAIKFSYLSSIETARGLSSDLAFSESYGDHRLGEHYLTRVEQVTADQVKNAASKFLVLDNASILEYRPSSQFDEKKDALRLRAAMVEGLKKQPEEGEATPSVRGETLAVKPSQASTASSGLVAPTAGRDTLSCGATLITRENHSLPLVSLGIYFKGGRSEETQRNAGITRLTLAGSLKGTGERTGEEIFNSIEMLGGTVGTEVEADYFGYTVKLLSQNLNPGLEIMADVVKDAVFAPEELDKERRILLARIQKNKDNMRDYPVQLFYQAAFPDHPYGLGEWGREDAVQNLSQSQVREWYNHHFSADNMTLVAVGDFDSSCLKRDLEELLKGLERGPIQRRGIPESGQESQQKEMVENRAKAQTSQALGFVTCSYREDDFYALKVLQAVASGTGGRFFHQLREKRGLAYTVYGVNDSWRQAGAFYAYIATSPGNEEVARRELLNEFYRFKSDLIEEEELETAKNYISGMYSIYLETNSGLVSQYAKAALVGKGIGAVEQYPQMIGRVTREQVREVAGKYFDEDNLAVGVLRGGK